MALRRRAKVPAGTKLAQPVVANAGVEAWYRDQLQRIVVAMSKDMLAMVKDAWREGGGIVTDAVPFFGAGVILRSGGRVLLLQRSDGSGWGLPGGGMEPGETPQATVVRECGEEIGHQPTEDMLEWLCVSRWRNVRFATFTVDLPAVFIPTLNDEHSAFAWVDPRHALELLPLHPALRPTLEFMLDTQALAMDARPKPGTPTLLRRALAKWGERWTKRINVASEKIALDFAVKNRNATERGFMRTLKDAGFTVKFKPSKLSVQAFEAVVAENVGLIRSIPQRFLTDVQNTVWQNVMDGGDLNAITESIHQKYEIAHRRAALIARDQNHKAKAAMERAARLEVGIDKAVWKHSHAGKEPRPTHQAMDGKPYEIAQGMYDSAVKKWIWPGTEINCRCTDMAVVPGFD